MTGPTIRVGADGRLTFDNFPEEMGALERMGRALSAEDARTCDAPPPEWTSLTEEKRSLYLDQAQAALAAIREPSESMIVAAQISDAWNAGDPDAIWQIMVDAALAEK